MNITTYRESDAWLFAKRSINHRCLWSLGRYPPPVDVGDDLIFRTDGAPVARALCRRIYEPGEFDCMMHDGSRKLRGWKVLWYQPDFEDLRPLNLAKSFGKPISQWQENLLRNVARGDAVAFDGPKPPGTNRATVQQLLSRGLISLNETQVVRLTPEGLRVVRREMTPDRRADIEDTDDNPGDPCCRICGCTELHGCPEGCSWTGEHLPPLCTACEYIMLDAGTDLLSLESQS